MKIEILGTGCSKCKAFFEILGCFAFWLYFRAEKTPWWIALGVISLILLLMF